MVDDMIDLTNNREHVSKVFQKLKNDYAKDLESTSSNVLFDVEDKKREKVFIVFSMCKIPEIPVDGKTKPMTIKSSLPHGYIDSLHSVLLISRDLKGHIKKSRPYDRSLQHFKDLLKDHKASHLVTQVMPLKQLRKDYLEPEAKRMLAQRFDYVLCDSTVMKRVPVFLGKAFYGNNKKPVQVDLKSNKLARAIKNALSKCVINLSLNGSTASGQFGRMDQPADHLVDNLLAVVETLKKRVPGGEKNIRSMHVTYKSESIPIFHNPTNPKDLPDVKHPNTKVERSFTNQLTTLKGHTALINVTGTTIHLVRKGANSDEICKIRKTLDGGSRLKFCPKTNKLVNPKLKRLEKKLRRIYKAASVSNKAAKAKK